MFNSDSTGSSSWDFSQVYDLLRSPTYETTSRPSRYFEPTPPSIQEQTRTIPNDDARPRTLTLKSSHPQLGDFGPVWELLNHAPAPVSLTPTVVTAKPILGDTEPASQSSSAFSILKRPTGGTSPKINVIASTPFIAIDRHTQEVKYPNATTGDRAHHSFSQTQPISILKKAASKQVSGNTINVKFDHPRTPTKQTAATDSSSDTPKPKAKSKAREKSNRANTRKDPISSEGSAGVDSDSSIVFDRPVATRTGALAFVPAQLGTPEATNDNYETPPSSFDDQEWTLNADTIRNGIRVRSTLYKSPAERRVALMTRLLKDFPNYAQTVSRLGHSANSHTNKSVGSQPIHIFVDMSNVRLCVRLILCQANSLLRS